jgi:hypothetical protein
MKQGTNMTNNFGVRSPHNPFLIGEFVNFKFNKEKYYNAQYIGQLSPYDIDDTNPLLLFQTFEGKKLRIKLKAIYIIDFDVGTRPNLSTKRITRL